MRNKRKLDLWRQAKSKDAIEDSDGNCYFCDSPEWAVALINRHNEVMMKLVEPKESWGRCCTGDDGPANG